MSKPFHILVADDDDDDQMLIAEAISVINRDQVKVTRVFNGVELLKYLHENCKTKLHPDVLLLDINMPMLNGLEALTKIREDRQLKDLPVFMISTLRTPEREEQSIDLGAKHFYTKPNSLNEFTTIMREIFAF